MALVFGLLSALTYGAADFIGGFVSRRAPVLVVVIFSQALTIPLVVAAVTLIPGDLTRDAFVWGAASGVAGAIGVALLYRGLARGKMSLVAPITAVEAAGVPVVFGLLVGERPSSLSLVGVAIAIVAITLVSLVPEPESDGAPRREQLPLVARPGVPEAVAAGLAFAAFFVLLERAGDGVGAWPLVGARLASLAVVLGAAVVIRAPLRPPSRTLPLIAASGVLDVAANVFYLLGTQRGLLSIVAVLTSLYPAGTVLLARIVLRERLTSGQIAGLGCAAVGVVLIAAG